jgi:hypothetical protein
VQRDGFHKRVATAYSRTSGECAYNLGVIVVALIVLTIMIEWLSTAWMAFEKIIGLTF